MKVSARNVFQGKVSALRAGPVHTEVELAIGDDRLVAVINDEGVRALGLAVGTDAVALVKAPWVMLLTNSGEVRLSPRNHLRGTITAVAIGAVNAEVTLTLASGTEVSAVVTKEAVQELGLKVGTRATAIIKASDVVLARPG